jgi:3-oxoacyl-[acyl-carrier-protein] synthase-3
MQTAKFIKYFLNPPIKIRSLRYFFKFAETTLVKAYIKAISYILPEKVFSNDDFFALFPESLPQKDNYMKIGVSDRRIVENNVTASDLGISAGEALFKEHNIQAEEIDFLFFCALEFDYQLPSSACVIHEKLNLPKSCGATDYNLGCSGFVYGLGMAKGLIESCGLKNVLLITSSTLTKTIHEKDKSSRFVFGDGAAATLISAREEEPGFGSFVFGTDGKRAEKIIIKDGGGRNPVCSTSFKEHEDDYGNVTSDAHFYMEGTSVFLFGLKTVPAMINDLISKENLTLDDIDLFVFHQANLFLIDTIRAKMKIPEEKVYNYMEHVGNTVAATIPIALCEAIKEGKAKPGQKILLAGFGVGLSWAATIVRL